MDPYLDLVESDRAVEVSDPAITYPFELDNFQKQAQYYIELGDNVLIIAHTSSGKTVVAEYGIARAKKCGRRAFYASPIKTLSNQKYQEFSEKFGDVGLLTGDIKCNPDAQCVIMTTEILRDMLYKENYQKSLEDVDCIIFDEIHYINNLERGHVWEECLVKLPPSICIIGLSATISEAEKFASWIANMKQRPIHLIKTLKRPIPLNHYAYINDQLHLILNEKGSFHEQNHRKYYQEYDQLMKKYSFNSVNLLNPCVAYLHKNNLNPTIFFSFSRKKCQIYAKKVTIGLVDPREQSKINDEINKYLAKHSIEKSTLEKIPQVIELRELLMNGIGIHHSGLLPVLKEIVEILFSQGLIKILFATETFAVGVNMPTRTVVFTELTKYCDGNDQPRLLKPDEYFQMSGRAGRRGLDQSGTVIHLPLSGVPETAEVKGLLLGKSARIESKFKINYAYVLQVLANQKGVINEDITQKSYLSQQYTELINGLMFEQTQLKDKLKALSINPFGHSDQIDKINQLMELEKKLVVPKQIGNCIVQMNKNQEKKLRAEIRKISNQINNIKDLSAIKELILQQQKLTEQITTTEESIAYYQNILNEQCQQCLTELTQLGYLQPLSTEEVGEGKVSHNIIQLTHEQLTEKGIIASYIVSANEILLTELIKQEKLDNLDLPSIAAILSLFCEDARKFNDDSVAETILPGDTLALIDWLYKMSQQYCHRYKIYEAEYQEKGLNDTFANVAYRWAQGATYFEIIPYLETFEGNFIRNMLRLSHICDEIIKVCEVTQNPVLEKKMTDLKTVLIRDIVTFDSLYLKI